MDKQQELMVELEQILKIKELIKSSEWQYLAETFIPPERDPIFQNEEREYIINQHRRWALKTLFNDISKWCQDRQQIIQGHLDYIREQYVNVN